MSAKEANGMRTIAVYVRTSTSDQHGEAQVHALERAMAAREIAGQEVRWYRDIGHTGTNTSRPAMQELRQAVHRGEVGEVFVYALDRLARSLRDLLDFTEALRRTQTTLVVIREQIDLGTATGRMVMSVLGAIAEFEHSLTMERVALGKERAKARALPQGRPHAITPDQVAQAREMRTEGHSIRYIAQAIGATRGTVHRVLTKEEEFKYVKPGPWRKHFGWEKVG